MKRRTIVVLSIFFMCLISSYQLLYAAKAKKKPAPAKEEQVLITIWKGPNTDHDPQIYADVIGAFQAKHPNVKVELIPTPWETIAEKYGTAFAAGNNPDIIYGFTGGYVDAVVTKCHDFRKIFSKEDLDFIMKGVPKSMLLESTLPDGKLVGIPFYAAPQSLTWNVDLLKEAGFTKPPDTYDELLVYAKKLTKDLNGDGEIDQWGWGQISYDTAEQKPEHFLFAFGATLLNEKMDDIGYDNEGGMKAFQFIDKLWNVEKVAVPIGLYPGTTMIDAFFDGVYAMLQSPGQIVTNLKNFPNFRLMSGPMPKGPATGFAGGRGTYAGSGFWCIAENTKHLALVKEYVKMLYDPKYSVPIARATGFFPVNSEVKIELDPISKGYFESLKYGVPYRFSPRVQEVKQAVWDAMQALQAGAIGPEDAWRQAVENGRAAFD